MYQAKSLIAIVLLLGIVVAFGVIIGQGEITGNIITNQVACYKNADCSDHIEETEDICKNPGTEYSLCVNRPKE